MEDDRRINSHGIYSFIVCGQIYHKLNMTQNAECVIQRSQYGQLYFLDPNGATNERVNNPLNAGVSPALMKLPEHIIRACNGYVQGYIMMPEVEEKVNHRISTQGISPPYVKLLFRQPEQADHRRFNIPACYEVCAVFPPNVD